MLPSTKSAMASFQSPRPMKNIVAVARAPSPVKAASIFILSPA
jgi:hypothetical protein